MRQTVRQTIKKTMRKYIILNLVLTISFVFLLFGCGQAPEPAFDYVEVEAEFDEAEEEPEAEPVADDDEFWEDEFDEEEAEERFPMEAAGIHGLISRVEVGDNAMYIFGSMHYGRPGWFPLHPAVEGAMRRSDAFVFETDITTAGQEAIAPRLLEYMLLPNMTLSEFLEEDVFHQMMSAVETYGVSYQAIRQFTPWVVNVFMAEIAYERAGITSDDGVDFYMLEFAQNYHLPILYLNSLEQEMDLAFNLTDEMQHYAALGIENIDVATAHVEMLVTAYETQDIPWLTTLIRESSTTGAAPNPLEEYLIDVILVQRSVLFGQEMIRLLEQTEEPTTFFVTMGIGHMVGDDHGNVLNVIQDAGFEVTTMWR